MLYNTRIKISVGCNILSRVQNNVGNIKSGLNLAIIVGTWYVYLPTHIWYMHDFCACTLLQTFVSCLKSRPISWIWIRKLNWLTWLYIDCRIRSPSLAHFIKPLATIIIVLAWLESSKCKPIHVRLGINWVEKCGVFWSSVQESLVLDHPK